MRPAIAKLFIGLLAVFVLAGDLGCASSSPTDDFHRSDDYYRRTGSVHRDSFPTGSGSPYGRYGRYRRY